MQPTGNRKLRIKNICLLLFGLGIIILGAVCCGYGTRGMPTASPMQLSGQCEGNSVASVAGERTLAVMTRIQPDIILCILRASDGAVLRRYDLMVYGNVVGHGDGLLYTNEGVGQSSSTLCAIHISDGIERWCQPQQNAIDSVITGNGNVYAISNSAGQALITALSERDGRILWTSSLMTVSNPTNHLLMTIGPGAIYTYQTISPASPTPTTTTGQAVAPEASGLCAVRARDGRQLWCYPLPGQSITGLVTDGSSLYARAINGYSSVYALNAANGAMRWHQQIQPPLYADASAQLIVAHGMLFTDEFGISSANSITGLTQLYAMRASDGHQVWSVSLKGGQIASLAVTDNSVYAATAFGDLHALNIFNGQSAWSYKSVPTENSASYYKPAVDMLVAHDVVYMQSGTEASTYLLAINAQDRTALWKDRSCSNTTATPATVGSDETGGRCYWAGNGGQQNFPLNLLQIDN